MPVPVQSPGLDLGASHVIFEVVSLFPGRFVPVGACDVVPHVRKHIESFRTPRPRAYMNPRLMLRDWRDPDLRTFWNQRTASASSLRTPMPVVVHDPEVVLRLRRHLGQQLDGPRRDCPVPRAPRRQGPPPRSRQQLCGTALVFYLSASNVSYSPLPRL